MLIRNTEGVVFQARLTTERSESPNGIPVLELARPGKRIILGVWDDIKGLVVIEGKAAEIEELLRLGYRVGVETE